MLSETMATPFSKKKAAANANKLNNPKYLQIQLMQMSKILKDTTVVKDKKIKQSLQLLTEYHVWEKELRESMKKVN